MAHHNVFMFTIATNGYDEIFADWIKSQRDYACAHNYRYLAITQAPTNGISGTNSAWLKLAIIARALVKGYAWVVFVDADCLIRLHAPPVESVQVPQKSIYCALDFSNRINGGVILARNTEDSQRFFQKILRWSDLPTFFLPKTDQNLYENGHLIFFAKRNSAVCIIDQRWNNTTNQPIGEYIWHGGGRYEEKPRSKSKSLTLIQALSRRVREGPRSIYLKRLARYYEEIYQI